MKKKITFLSVTLLLGLAEFIWSNVQATPNEAIWGNVLPFNYMVVLGQVPKARSANIFGFNNDINAIEESVWDLNDIPSAGDGPLQCFGLGQTPVNLYASSDNDLDAGKMILVTYLDADYFEKFEFIALGAANGDGTAFVQVGTETILRVNNVVAIVDGLVGNLYIHKDPVDADDY